MQGLAFPQLIDFLVPLPGACVLLKEKLSEQIVKNQLDTYACINITLDLRLHRIKGCHCYSNTKVLLVQVLKYDQSRVYCYLFAPRKIGSITVTDYLERMFIPHTSFSVFIFRRSNLLLTT